MDVDESVGKLVETLEEIKETDAKMVASDHIKIVPAQPIEEMLGSVTTYNNVDGSDVFGSPKNFQQLRTSARVFKKMKLDSALSLPSAQTPEKEKKDMVKDEVKLEVKKPLRPSWSQEDKDIFFEALNEYGKDFEAIQQHINNKFKKKSLPDSVVKTKDQIRHFYYRTWHKVAKHLKFSDDIKKPTQELYALINYGELRKKVGSVSEKVCMKLNELIFRGSLQLRVKGKTVRIKTPMCRALRRLNELDEKHEDLKLPTRVLVELRPKNMESWLKVQFMAQNPRVKVSLPLQKRVSALLQCMSSRWKTNIARAHEKVLNSVNNITSECLDLNTSEDHKAILSPQLRFTPKANCPVEVPTINLSEYLTSQRICLNAYEERIGVKVSSEKLWQTSNTGFKGGGKLTKKGAAKRQRHESICDKNKQNEEEKHNNNKLQTELDTDVDNVMTVSEVVDSAVNTILALQCTETSEIEKGEVKEEIKEEKIEETNQDKKLEIFKIKTGWTLEDCGTLTIGELYLMFGQDSKLILEYSWDPPNKLKTEQEDNVLLAPPTESIDSEADVKLPNELSLSLKKLLSVAKLHYRKEKIHCPCGHVCGGAKSSSAARNKNIASKTNQKLVQEVQDKVCVAKTNVETPKTVAAPQNCIRNVTIKQDSIFRRPSIYPGNGSSNDSFRAQLDSLQKMRPRYCNRKGRPVRSKHVVVERMLPLLPKPPVNGHSIVTMKVISQVTPRPIAPKVCSVEEEETEVSTNNNITVECPDTNITLFGSSNDNVPQVSIPEAAITDMSDQIPNRDVTSPTSISNFLDLDIPNTDTNDLILSSTVTNVKDGITSFAGLLSDENPCPNSTPLSSPSRILKENDIQWLNSEVNDYSLTSLLGHLESPLKTAQTAIITGDDNVMSQDIDVQFPSLLGENGVDFVEQFVDMAAHATTDTSEIEQVHNL